MEVNDCEPFKNLIIPSLWHIDSDVYTPRPCRQKAPLDSWEVGVSFLLDFAEPSPQFRTCRPFFFLISLPKKVDLSTCHPVDIVIWLPDTQQNDMRRHCFLKPLITGFALAAVPATSSAASIGLIDFESDAAGFFTFAQNAANVSTVHPAVGTDGSRGVAASVSADPGSYAGAGLGNTTNNQFDLSRAGFVGGSLSVADFDTIAGNFDVNIPVGQSLSIRIEPVNGGYNERVDLGVTIPGTGEFQNIAFDAASASDANQKTTFVNTLNGASATGLKFIFSINNQTGAVGSQFVFDNIEFSAGAVPEPSSFVLALSGVMMLLGRRKR